MAYPPEIAAALSGASLRQLSYWRSARTPEPLLSPEYYKPRSRVTYSFRDVVALRAFVYLCTAGVSLQRVRKAVNNLKTMGELDHLSKYQLVAIGGDVVWRISDAEAVDLTGAPGQHVIADMVDIVRPFENRRGATVVDLFEPAPGVQVDPDVRGGFPVIQGTRVPFDVVAGLVASGASADEVRGFYPSVEPWAVEGALEFAQHVEGQDLARLSA